MDLCCGYFTQDDIEEVVNSNEDRNQPLPVNTMPSSRKKPTSRISKQYNKRREGTFIFSRNDSTLEDRPSLQDKPAWRHPDRYPKNLEQSTILTTSWLTRQQWVDKYYIPVYNWPTTLHVCSTRCNNYHPSLNMGNYHHTLLPNMSVVRSSHSCTS